MQYKKRRPAGPVRKRHIPNIDVRMVAILADEGVSECWNGFKGDGATGGTDKIEKLRKMKSGVGAYVEYDLARSEKASVAPAEKAFVIWNDDPVMQLSKGFRHGNRRAEWSTLRQGIFRFCSQQCLHNRT
jgi:hypothetical protein